MTTYINATPHPITLNSGETFAKSEFVARVSTVFSEVINGECTQTFGAVEGLPAQVEGVKYIVSAMVLAASKRTDLVAPATGHPDTIRNEKGHIVSVPCFVRPFIDNKLNEAIEAVRAVRVDDGVIGMLSMLPCLNKTAARNLAETGKSFTEIALMTSEELRKIAGVGDRTARNLRDAFDLATHTGVFEVRKKRTLR